MHTLALPKSVLCIELGPRWPLAHYELAHLIKKKIDAVVLRLCSAAPRRLTPGDDHNVVLQPFNPIFQTMVRFWIGPRPPPPLLHSSSAMKVLHRMAVRSTSLRRGGERR